MHGQKSLSIALAATLILSLASPLWAMPAQQGDPAMRLLERMPADVRVGQLFIVTFPGTDTGDLTAIRTLITEDRVGGVLLRAENGNIDNVGNTPVQVADLTRQLQQLAIDATQIPSNVPIDEAQDTPTLPPYIPLFLAVEQSGNGRPNTSIVSGTTPLPSLMTIGATWNTDYAETVGDVVGQELSALGINMLLGPSLDVLNNPRPGSAADLGVQSFGGDPYWVGQMGAAYIRGIHQGSEGRVAAIGSHFPGLGAADRPLTEEVSTIQKSLEQLKQIELAPFFAVAGAADPESRADGFLVSHIRYRGFQGNIRSTTKPVSFDSQALQQLMSLPELAPWRSEGGLTVADELGVRAVSRFYDPTEATFNGLRIAHDAFLAGNDLLILSQFALNDDWDRQIANIRGTIAFFREKYNTDPSFQFLVDQAVLRILRLKYGLYGTFLPSTVLANLTTVSAEVGRRREEIVPVTRDATTLLSPLSADLRPAPPADDEWIVIFTDDRQLSPCRDCPPTYAIPPTALADTMINLYGPQATSQVDPARISSYSFARLADYLAAFPEPLEEDATPTPPQEIQTILARADWIIFAMLDIGEQSPSSLALRRFLAEQADLLRNKKVIVLAFGAPYHLDTTEIAKLSAYFGLYTRIAPAIENGVRALFDEFPFNGAPPVSVAGINYDLITQTQPDPEQTIDLFIGDAVEASVDGTPQPMPQLNLGDSLPLRTSVIADRNGNPVPDGTPVEFILTYPQEGLELTIQKTTRNGVATIEENELTLDRPGILQISVRAEPVQRSVRLEITVSEGGPATILSTTPTPVPQQIFSPVATPEPTLEATAQPEPPEPNDSIYPQGRVDGQDLVQGFAGMLCVVMAAYLILWQRSRSLSIALRGALFAFVGGLVGYIAYAIGLPGSNWWLDNTGVWATGTIAATGAAISLTAAMIYEAVRRGQD